MLLLVLMVVAMPLAAPAAAQDDGCVDGSFEVLRPDSTDVVHPSDHFAVRWNDDDGVQLSSSQIQFGQNVLEDLWRFYVEELGFPEPYCDTAEKYKVSVNVSDQGWATGAGTGFRDPEMWVHYNAFNAPGVLAHEFTHTLQFTTLGMRDSDYVGWFWESHAEWMRYQFPAFRNEVGCSEMLVNFPHLYYGSTRDRYCNWQFWEFVKNRHGYEAVNDIWANAKEPGESGYREEDPFSVLARNQGWSVSELNDEFGWWALHNATWDYTNPDGSDQGVIYRDAYGAYDDRSSIDRYLRTTQLEALDLEQGRFVVPELWAPQRWGYNLVRLYPEDGASTVAVTFRGVVQEEPHDTRFGLYANTPYPVPDPDSGWRWGLVVLGADGERRYSELQRGPDGEVIVEVQPDDEELWLAVVGAPTTIHQVMWDQMYFTLYRYPWMVELDGAVPEGFQEGVPTPTERGRWHANGGGWVSSRASVAETAYVGPNAIVLGGVVEDEARIEDHAVVWGGIISDSAVVGGLSLVRGGIEISGGARAETVFMGPGAFAGRQSLSGTAHVYGDLEMQGEGLSLSDGVYYGYLTAEMASNPRFGAQRDEPPPGVTAPGPYEWRDELVATEDGMSLPGVLTLSQNYPNPFTRATTIAYELPEAAHVHLQVFDVLGREVATLVDAPEAAGRHEARLDAKGLAGGVYYYRLEAGGHTETRSLVVVEP